MNVTVLSVDRSEHEERYLVDLVLGSEAHRFSGSVQTDRIGGEQLLTASEGFRRAG